MGGWLIEGNEQGGRGYGHTDLNSNIDLHPLTPHGIFQLAAHACNPIWPSSVIDPGGWNHFRCPVQSQPSVAIGERLELRVGEGVGLVL